MTIIQTITLALVEGLTEFLPISSTGHLILAEHFLKIPSTDFVKSFNILIQLGAILAVVWHFRQKLFSSLPLLTKLFLAFLPTGLIGFLLYPLIKNYLLDSPLLVATTLLLGGLILLLVDQHFSKQAPNQTINKLPLNRLLSIGIFQSLSMIPGVSRSAATIVGGLFSGLSRLEAVEFSFLLALPTMFAATGLDLLKSSFSFNSQEILLLAIGLVVAFFSALLAIKTFLKFVAQNNFEYFAYYRILLAIIVLLYLV